MAELVQKFKRYLNKDFKKKNMIQHFQSINIKKETINVMGLASTAVVAYLKPISQEAKNLMKQNTSVKDLERLDSHFIRMVLAKIKEISGDNPRGYALKIGGGLFLIYYLLRDH
ncbi:hypothetical protein JXC34_05210 [Candidatus Woesearchaeota archaeon]|nr:hypothetical protein [Candidatus Woesearchaeota archaeon]